MSPLQGSRIFVRCVRQIWVRIRSSFPASQQFLISCRSICIFNLGEHGWLPVVFYFSLSSSITCLDFTCSLVMGNNYSAWCNRTLCQCKRCGDCSIGKQLFSFTKRQWVNFEPEFVH